MYRFDVVGMPEGIEFKKPYNYGTHQLRKIMESSNDITFVINKSEELHETTSFSPLGEIFTMEQVRSLLQKFTGLDLAEKALQNEGEKILQDVEVVNLTLTDEEKALLYTCGSEYFSPDAWLAVGHNMHIQPVQMNSFCPSIPSLKKSFGFFLSTRNRQRYQMRCFQPK